MNVVQENPNILAVAPSRRNGWIAALATLIFGVGIGHMYAGFLGRGIKWILLVFASVIVLEVAANFIPILGVGLVGLSILYKIIAAGDSFFVSSKGRLQPYNRWYLYLLAFTVLMSTALLIALISRSLIMNILYVQTAGMKPTMQPEDRVVAGRLIYKFSNPKSGDIVAFKLPDTALREIGTSKRSTDTFVKRIVAVGGDRVSIHDGSLFVNNKMIHEPYVTEPPMYERDEIVIPDNSYFILGDYRNDSYDSHMFGPVPRENIEAKIIYRLSPHPGPLN